MADPFCVATGSVPTGFMPSLAGFVSHSGVQTVPFFRPPKTLTQPTQIHPVYPNRPPPIPVTQVLPSGQDGPSTSPSLMACTTPGGGPNTSFSALAVVDGPIEGVRYLLVGEVEAVDPVVDIHLVMLHDVLVPSGILL